MKRNYQEKIEALQRDAEEINRKIFDLKEEEKKFKESLNLLCPTCGLNDRIIISWIESIGGQ